MGKLDMKRGVAASLAGMDSSLDRIDYVRIECKDPYSGYSIHVRRTMSENLCSIPQGESRRETTYRSNQQRFYFSITSSSRSWSQVYG